MLIGKYIAKPINVAGKNENEKKKKKKGAERD